MIKICYVVTVALTIKAFFVAQLKALANEGYEVSVVCAPDEELQSLLGENIRFIPIQIPRGISLFGSIRAIKRLKELFKKEHYDIVQYSTPNAALYASIAAKKEKVKIRNYHLMGFRYLGARGCKRKFLKWIEKKSCKNSTHIECVSASNLSLGVMENIFPEKKAVVVGNGSSGGVDLARFDIIKREIWRKEKREEYHFHEKDFIFGFVGRITKDKGVEELISAFEQLKECEHCKLVFIGRIDKNHGLKKKDLQKLNGDRILHIPESSQIERYYPMLDALVLPSYREGFGNVVIEAEAMGVPVLVSKIPGPIDAMIDGKTGFVFACRDRDALCEAMKKIMQVDHDVFGKQATAFVTVSFDQNILCHHILERKRQLINESLELE